MTTVQAIKDRLEKLAELNAIKSHLDSLNEQIADADKQAVILSKKLDKELKDFEDLQNMGVKGLFYKVLGSKEEQLEKERQDFLKANLKHKEAIQTLELLAYEKDLLKGKVDGIADIEQEIENLKKRREQEILSVGGEIKVRLLSIYKEVDDGQYFVKELNEAANAGNKALASTQDVLNHLNNAIKWGQWDMMSRGGGYNEHMKHGAIDRAMNSAYLAKQHIHIFKKELADIGRNNYDLHIELPEHGRFMDIFFDNLISDWIIQKKIRNVKANVSSIHDRIQLILSAIDQDRRKVSNRLLVLNNEKDNILTN